VARETAIARWLRLPERRQDSERIALENLNTARREHRPVREVTTQDGRISFRTQMKYTAAATRKDERGRIVPKQADRLFRPMVIFDEQGHRQLRAVYGSNKAALVGAHQAAIGHFLETGDERFLEPFRARRVAGVELASDPDVIERAAREGTLEDLEPYPTGGLG